MKNFVLNDCSIFDVERKCIGQSEIIDSHFFPENSFWIVAHWNHTKYTPCKAIVVIGWSCLLLLVKCVFVFVCAWCTLWLKTVGACYSVFACRPVRLWNYLVCVYSFFFCRSSFRFLSIYRFSSGYRVTDILRRFFFCSVLIGRFILLLSLFSYFFLLSFYFDSIHSI